MSILPIVAGLNAAQPAIRSEIEAFGIAGKVRRRGVACNPGPDVGPDIETGPVECRRLPRCQCRRGGAAEPIIEAGAKDIVPHARAVRVCDALKIECIVDRSEVEIEILGLAGPIASECRLDTAADRPAGSVRREGKRRGGSGARGFGQVALDTAVGQSARVVEQQGTGRISDAPAQGRKPGQLLLDREAPKRRAQIDTRLRVALITPLEITFDAEDRKSTRLNSSHPS